MSTTVVRAKRQTTLPRDVCQAGGIQETDVMEWRFEDGEIRGRKLNPADTKIRTIRPVMYKGKLVLPEMDIDYDQLGKDLNQDRKERDEKLLG